MITRSPKSNTVPDDACVIYTVKTRTGTDSDRVLAHTRPGSKLSRFNMFNPRIDSMKWEIFSMVIRLLGS